MTDTYRSFSFTFLDDSVGSVNVEQMAHGFRRKVSQCFADAASGKGMESGGFGCIGDTSGVCIRIYFLYIVNII